MKCREKCKMIKTNKNYTRQASYTITEDHVPLLPEIIYFLLDADCCHHLDLVDVLTGTMLMLLMV